MRVEWLLWLPGMLCPAATVSPNAAAQPLAGGHLQRVLLHQNGCVGTAVRLGRLRGLRRVPDPAAIAATAAATSGVHGGARGQLRPLGRR